MKRRWALFAAGLLGSVAFALQGAQQPLATRVEHFYVASDRAQLLFTYFKDTFQLPEVWPFFERESFASGGLSLGSAVLEFASFPKKDKEPVKTGFRGIALEPTASAEATAAELTDRRNISHTDVVTYKHQVAGSQALVEWSSVGLKDFPPAEADVFFCDYRDRPAVAARRKEASDELAARKGGLLGIVGVAEITVGVRDLEEARSKWSALLAPSPKIDNDIFAFDTGPRIRLVRAASPGIQGIVLSVRSLGDAERFLKECQLLSKDDAGLIFISPAAIDGLLIGLQEVPQP